MGEVLGLIDVTAHDSELSVGGFSADIILYEKLLPALGSAVQFADADLSPELMSALKRTPLSSQAAEAIIDLIRERRLRDGDKLPATGELAAMLDVSVPVIREATAGLVAAGLLKSQQGRESTVSVPDSGHLATLLGWRVSQAEVSDTALQEFREILEVGNARLAATCRTAASLAALESALKDLRDAGSPYELHTADVAFHRLVAQATGNDLALLTLDAIEPLLRRQRERVWNGWVTAGGDLESIVEAHALILDSIRQGDASGAAERMSSHLSQARHGLETPATSEGTAPFGP